MKINLPTNLWLDSGTRQLYVLGSGAARTAVPDGDYFGMWEGPDGKSRFTLFSPRLVEGNPDPVIYKYDIGMITIQLNSFQQFKLDGRGLSAVAEVGIIDGGIFSSIFPEVGGEFGLDQAVLVSGSSNPDGA